jgi:hypothetical protein
MAGSHPNARRDVVREGEQRLAAGEKKRDNDDREGGNGAEQMPPSGPREDRDRDQGSGKLRLAAQSRE